MSYRMTRREFVSAAALAATAATIPKRAAAEGAVPDSMDKRLTALVEKHTGHTATSIQELPWFDVYGDSNGTSYSVRCGEREYVVRVPRKAQEWPLRDLALDVDYHAVVGKYVCRQLRRRHLGAPIVYVVDRDCEIMDRPCSIGTRVPGRPWRYYEELWRNRELSQPPAHGREMGALVRGLHDIRARRGFGPVTDEGAGLVDSWAELTSTLFEAWAEKSFQRGAISEEQLALTQAIIEKWAPECETTKGRILWMADIMFGALVDAERRKVTGVSHAVEAWSGDPDYELEWFAYYAEDTDSLISPAAEFAEGYGRRYDEKSDKRRFYRMSVYLCKFTWIDMKTSRARHHQERFEELLRKLA